MSAATERPHIPALDGLRGLAIVLVLIWHYYALSPAPNDPPVHVVLQRASSLFFSGVDLFFVLSGFLIGGILLDHRDSPRLLPAFYARRFFRIVPLYALLLATFFLCERIAGLNSVSRGVYFSSAVPLWTYFGFLQNVAMALKLNLGPYWLSVTWSLCIEEQFYLLIPFIVLRSSPSQLARIAAGLIALSTGVRIVALLHADNAAAAIFLLPSRADGLLWGVCCALIVRNPGAMGLLQRRRALLSGGIAGLALLLGVFSAGRYSPISPEVVCFGYSLFNLWFALIVLHVASSPSTVLSRLASLRPLAFLGRTSYFTYLFHLPVWYSLHWIFFRSPPELFTWRGGAVTVLSATATLLLSWISWRIIEAPLRRFAQRFPYR